MTKPRYYRRPSWWRRLCARLDAHPIEITLVLGVWSYLLWKIIEAKGRGWL